MLVLLFPDEDGEARLVLTERVDRGGHHSGEVSFPGGRAEPDDADLVATALREAAEEVGLDADAAGVRVLGTLSMQWIPVSNFTRDAGRGGGRAAPRAGAAADGGRRDPRGAAGRLPARRRAAAGSSGEIREWDLRYAAYPVEGLAVWGMTARVLGGLGAWLAREGA